MPVHIVKQFCVFHKCKTYFILLVVYPCASVYAEVVKTLKKVSNYEAGASPIITPTTYTSEGMWRPRLLVPSCNSSPTVLPPVGGIAYRVV